MREIASATSGSGSSPDTTTKTLKPSIIEQVTINKGINSNSEQTKDGDGQEVRMEPTEEEQKKMLDFLMNLEQMKTSNPAEYEAVMASLTSGAPPGEGQKGDPVGAGGAPNNSIESIIAAVQGMRSPDADDGSASGINLGATKKPAPVGIKITPEPGFTFKTKRTDVKEESAQGKVFINICQHEKIAAPQLKKRLNDEGEEVEGMNIPMSVGAGRSGADKSGVPCIIYDIIVNPKVVDESVSDKSGKYRDFVCQLGMQCVEQKYSMVIDRRYKLPKLKYMGEPSSQIIQDRSKAPVIEEVAKDSEASKKIAAAKVAKAAEDAKAEAAALLKMEKPLPYTVAYATEGGAEEDQVFLALGHGEYRDPISVLEENCTSIVFRAEIDSYDLDLSKVVVKASPFQLTVKIPMYKALTLYLPCAVDPTAIACKVARRKGFTGLIDLTIDLSVDKHDWGKEVDPGSKPWLLSRALNNDESTTYNPYAADLQAGTNEDGVDANMSKEQANDDPFHLRLPPTKVETEDTPAPAHDEGDLPEDRFHKTDATSQYYVGLREQNVTDKWDKHKAEKAERDANPDPNVEYIDVDDFKPGGKLGPQNAAITKDLQEKEDAREELRKAASVVSSMVPQSDALKGLSSNLWAELL